MDDRQGPQGPVRQPKSGSLSRDSSSHNDASSLKPTPEWLAKLPGSMLLSADLLCKRGMERRILRKRFLDRDFLERRLSVLASIFLAWHA
jgi:hypothetical protein